MTNKQQFLTAVLVALFILTMKQVSNSAAQFIAMAVFVIVPVTTGYVIYRIALAIINMLQTRVGLAYKNNQQPFMSECAVRTIPNKANIGERIMDIPAYARKEKNIHYPISKEILDDC